MSIILKVGGIDFEQVIDYMRRNPEQFILKKDYTQLEGCHHLETTMGRRLDETLVRGTSLPGAIRDVGPRPLPTRSSGLRPTRPPTCSGWLRGGPTSWLGGRSGPRIRPEAGTGCGRFVPAGLPVSPGASSAWGSAVGHRGRRPEGAEGGAAQHFPPVTAARPSRSKFVSACADRENEP